jgi:hypothetical protein
MRSLSLLAAALSAKIASKNVTDSSLDSLQIDENRCQKLHKKLLLRRLQPVEEL